MLSQIYFVPNGENVNGQDWKLGEYLGRGFETHITRVLADELKPFYDLGVKIEPTPSSRDDGKDIIVESAVDLDHFMGFSFSRAGKEKMRIYVECKSSDSGNIAYNQIAGNVARIKDDCVNYYVLVTNTTIAPYSYYQFREDLQRLGITFYLLDQYLLSCYLEHRNAKIGFYSPLRETPSFHISYQLLSAFQDGKQIFRLYLLFRNYQRSEISAQLQVNTDRNWNISQQVVKRVLAPLAADCIELIIKKEYYDGLDELLLSLVVQEQEVFTKVKGLNWENSFIPPLCGAHHCALIDELVKEVQSANQYRFFYLWGEAGVGKTRIMDELMTRIQGRNVEVAVFRCAKGGGSLRKKFKDYFIKKDLIPPTSQAESLCELILQADTRFQRLLLIIDDLHNADAALLKEIRQMAEFSLEKPITLLVVGRNDYSVGSLEYYALLQRCIDGSSFRGWVLEAFDEEEAKQFIRLIVQDIPEFALQKIYALSNRIPLFIVETIEYLLDLKLVHIINRSSVGVQNPESFNSRLDIPLRIEDIYTKRFENLGLLSNGEHLQDFLLACTLMGINFPYEVGAAFFHDPAEDAKELFCRRFLSHGGNGDWQYIHESLYVFLKKRILDSRALRKKCAGLVMGFPAFHTLSDVQKGRVCLWAGDNDGACHYFDIAIQDISHIPNHSNINIDPDYYEYLEDIYDCATTSELQEKVILSKIYIALHYYTPYIAIQQCQWAEGKLYKSKGLCDREDLSWMLREHKAHCYLNAGQLKQAELLLQDLLAATVCDPGCVDLPTLFDLYDKLSNLNIKYNNKQTALKYIRLAEETARRTADDGLEALAYITHGKLHFFQDHIQTLSFVDQADHCLTKGGSDRIRLHNRVTRAMLHVLDSAGDVSALERLRPEVKELLDICTNKQYANSIIRADLLLGVVCFLTDAGKGQLKGAEHYLHRGIDASLQFGIGTYMWQIYNLLAVIAIHQKTHQDHQARLFETVYLQLRRQNMLYIGAPDLCYGNLLAISNVAGFFARHNFESEFYQKMRSVSYMAAPDVCGYDCGNRRCNYVCAQSTERLKKELKHIQRALDSGDRLPLPFQDVVPTYPLWDNKSKCYIILS